MEEKVRVVLEFSFEVPALSNVFLPRGADTYHDFRPACAVGVMRPVSTPRLCGDIQVSRYAVHAVRHGRLRGS